MSSDRGNVESEHIGREIQAGHHGSMDAGDLQNARKYPPQKMSRPFRAPLPPSLGSPRAHRPYNGHPITRAPHQLHSVVTTSFSVDEDREDTVSRVPVPRAPYPNSYHRQDTAERHSMSREDRHPRDGPSHQDTDECDVDMRGDESDVRDEAHEGHRRPPSYDGPYARPVPVPPSSKQYPPSNRELPSDQRGPVFVVPSDNLKRSFWHHARLGEQYSSPTHPAFMPPKRTKVTPTPKRSEAILIPRTPVERAMSDDGHTGWYHRTNSWGAQDEREALYHQHQVRRTQSFPSPWVGTPGSAHPARGIVDGPYHQPPWSGQEQPFQEPDHQRHPSAFRTVGGHVPPQEYRPYPPPLQRTGSYAPTSAGHWRRPHESSWAPPSSSPRAQPVISPSWSGPHAPFNPPYRRDIRLQSPSSDSHPLDSPDNAHVRRQVTFECGGEMEAYRHYHSYEKSMMQQKPDGSLVSPMSRVHGTSRSPPSTADTPRQGQIKSGTLTVNTNDTMTRSGDDGPIMFLSQPEDRISLSETLCTIRENIEVFTASTTDVDAPAPGRKHPVVVGQVGLRCIHCRHTTKSSDRVKRAVCYPSSIKRIYRTVIDMKLDHFQHCKFVPTALKERLDELKAINTRSTGTTMQYFVRAAKKMGMFDGPSGVRLSPLHEGESKIHSASSDKTEPESPEEKSNRQMLSRQQSGDDEEREPTSPRSDDGSEHSVADGRERSASEGTLVSSDGADDNNAVYFSGNTVLAVADDKMALSPLRCFLRENVCAFSATEEDIAVRTPTTFSVVLGQVGIGCIHCHTLPAKERSNRAVCFPFSIARIYQSVADIQRFHLGECKMVPSEVREKFLSLQSASSKGSKGLATRQYWVTSARKIGLVDSPNGIRFGRDPSVPSAVAISLDILAQVASNVTTVNRPLVLPEDKPCIAEFLYAVMEQLQPCRFTEADRNKRRLKDVGCIGVECKHCAGQVESRKFFWSSVNAVESNFVSVHTHMMECRMVPDSLKAHLGELKKLRKEQTGRLQIGSQKAFFARVWRRLHGEDPSLPTTGENNIQQDNDSSFSSLSVETVSEQMAVVSV